MSLQFVGFQAYNERNFAAKTTCWRHKSFIFSNASNRLYRSCHLFQCGKTNLFLLMLTTKYRKNNLLWLYSKSWSISFISRSIIYPKTCVQLFFDSAKPIISFCRCARNTTQWGTEYDELEMWILYNQFIRVNIYIYMVYFECDACRTMRSASV